MSIKHQSDVQQLSQPPQGTSLHYLCSLKRFTKTLQTSAAAGGGEDDSSHDFAFRKDSLLVGCCKERLIML